MVGATQKTGSGLDRPPEQVSEWRRVWVEDERDACDARRHLLERFQPLGPIENSKPVKPVR